MEMKPGREKKKEFVEGNGQHGKKLFRNEVTIMLYVPHFEVLRTFSVMSTCSILRNCEMPLCVLQRSCGSRYRAHKNTIVM